jgi:quercetin dioxygenase-like cupin family protein
MLTEVWRAELDPSPTYPQQINFMQVGGSGQHLPEHRHPYLPDIEHGGLWETFVCLQGAMTVTTRAESATTFSLRPGDAVVVPPGVWHKVKADPGTRYIELKSLAYDPEDERQAKEYSGDAIGRSGAV